MRHALVETDVALVVIAELGSDECGGGEEVEDGHEKGEPENVAFDGAGGFHGDAAEVAVWEEEHPEGWEGSAEELAFGFGVLDEPGEVDAGGAYDIGPGELVSAFGAGALEGAAIGPGGDLAGLVVAAFGADWGVGSCRRGWHWLIVLFDFILGGIGEIW